jgi:L-fuconolactonase
MLKIDAHQHFWKFDPVRDSWINDEMAVIQRDFMPDSLEPILRENGLDGCITVQSDQSELENAFQLTNAARYDFIKGVVGWVDLQGDDVEQRLAYYHAFPKLKGFRHVLQAEPQRNFMLRPAFLNGIGLLKKYGFTYDILIFPDQLLYTADFVSRFPDQPFIINHLAKPAIKHGQIGEWRDQIAGLAAFENVFCKVSGMVTEADWQKWKPADFYPYLDVVVEAFGMQRLLFGSDWPVCNVAASYGQILGLVKDYFSEFSLTEQEQFFGGNAIKFYNL